MTKSQDRTPQAQHRGRKFRGKRLKTSLPRLQTDAPLPERKDTDRIAKVIARAGLASRREAEAWIEAGRVAVNGEKITSAARNVGPKDRITVDGRPLPQRERTRLFLFHKPRGLVTTSADPQGRPTIFGALPKDMPRVISIGRLDLNTEGILLLTNDGGLARALELPSTGWLRRYRVRAYGKVTQPRLDALRNGIEVDGIQYGAIEATLDREQGDNVWLTFAMREGKNREIRNVLGALGLKVNRLIRLSYGPFQLGELPAGAVEEIKTRALREQLGERITALAGADFSGPIVEREPEPAPHAQSSHRHPEVRGAERRAAGSRLWPTSAIKDRSRLKPTSAGDGPSSSARDRHKGPLGLPANKSSGRLSPDKIRGRSSFEGRLRRPPQDDGERKESRGKHRVKHREHGGSRDKPERRDHRKHGESRQHSEHRDHRERGEHRGHRGHRGQPHRGGKRPR